MNPAKAQKDHKVKKIRGKGDFFKTFTGKQQREGFPNKPPLFSLKYKAEDRRAKSKRENEGKMQKQSCPLRIKHGR